MTLPLQSVCVGYAVSLKAAALAPATGKQINLFEARAVNQSGAAIDVGIAKLLATASWKLGILTAASSPEFTDFTSAIQGGGAVNIFTTTNNDGFLVGALVPFNVIGLTISQPSTGSPVYAYKYFNGTSYVALTTQNTPAPGTTGDQLIVFQAPSDWVVGTTTAVGGDATKYNIQVIATTAPTQIVQADAAWVAQFLEFQPGLADKTGIDFRVMDSALPLTLSGNEGLVPYFGTANAKNLIRALYSTG